MKSFIALCFLAAFCAVQVSSYNPLEQLKNQLDMSKANVESIIADLKRTENNLGMSTRNKLSTLRSQSMSSVNSIVDPAFSSIRASVDAAKAEGKDAEHCYTDARESLRSISSTAFSGLQLCEANANRQLQQQLNPLETAQAIGQQYLTQLNSVFLNCYQSNVMQMQTCVAIKLGQINQSIRVYESDVNTVKRNAEHGANDAYLFAYNCNFQPVSDIRSKTTNVKIAANKCIAN